MKLDRRTDNLKLRLAELTLKYTEASNKNNKESAEIYHNIEIIQKTLLAIENQNLLINEIIERHNNLCDQTGFENNIIS